MALSPLPRAWEPLHRRADRRDVRGARGLGFLSTCTVTQNLELEANRFLLRRGFVRIGLLNLRLLKLTVGVYV